MSEDIFKNYGLRINLKADFAKVREVLTRMGIANYKTKTLTQTCHIFHKRGQYALMHFKEMFLFDGKDADLTEEDIQRCNRIAKMLEEWGLIEFIDEDPFVDEGIAPLNAVNVISRKTMMEEKWTLIKKYTLGKKKT